MRLRRSLPGSARLVRHRIAVLRIGLGLGTRDGGSALPWVGLPWVGLPRIRLTRIRLAWLTRLPWIRLPRLSSVGLAGLGLTGRTLPLARGWVSRGVLLLFGATETGDGESDHGAEGN